MACGLYRQLLLKVRWTPTGRSRTCAQVPDEISSVTIPLVVGRGWTPVAAWPDSSTEMAAALRELHQRQCGEDCRVNSVDQELLIVPDEDLGAWVIEQTDLPMMRWLGNCHVRVELLQDSLPEWNFMRLNTLEGMRVCMKRLSPRIELSGESLECARLPIERMRTISVRRSEI